MDKEKDIVIKRFKDCKTARQEYTPLWKDVQCYVAPSKIIKDFFEDETSRSEQKDVYINDPTAYISVVQAADYLLGIIWGNGNNVFQIEPSRYVKDLLSDENELDEFFKWQSTQILEEMNHSESGFINALKSHLQDQQTFGTSGIGTYINDDFVENKAQNALSFNRYGVYNSCIDEGANGKINVVFSVHNWRVSRIVDTFAVINDELDKGLLAKLPEEIQKAYEAGNYNQKFKIVHGVMPHSEYSIGKIGKNGTKFKGFWFYEAEQNIFAEEFYQEMPIAMCRAIKIPDEEYGSSSGILAISSIKMLNYITGNTIEAIEKLVGPAFGMFSGALANGSIIDTSANEINVFNGKAADGNPMFKISDVGDISGSVNLLIPKAERDITTIFKIDQLLDFNNSTQMTATESLQRFSIRAKSLAGMIQQQKNELLIPMIKRAISLLSFLKLLGVNPEENKEQADKLIELQKSNQVIPEEVLQVIKEGKPYYTIKFNNELDQMEKSEQYDAFTKFILLYSQLLQLDPSLQMGVKSFNMLEYGKNTVNLGNEDFMLSENDYNKAVEAQQQAQQDMMKLEAENKASGTIKNMAGAEKDARQSQAQ